MVRFIDSNLFIYHIDKNPVFGQTSQKILQRVESGEEAVSSTLVLEEVFIHVEQEYSAQDIPSVLYSILSYVNLRIVPYTVEDMLNAAEILEDAGFTLDWDDAVIVAVMERFGIKEIYSNDHHFDRVPSVRRVFE